MGKRKTSKPSSKCARKPSAKTSDTISKVKRQLAAKNKEIAKLKSQHKSAAAATKAFYDIMKSKGFSGRKDPIKQIKK